MPRSKSYQTRIIYPGLEYAGTVRDHWERHGGGDRIVLYRNDAGEPELWIERHKCGLAIVDTNTSVSQLCYRDDSDLDLGLFMLDYLTMSRQIRYRSQSVTEGINGRRRQPKTITTPSASCDRSDSTTRRVQRANRAATGDASRQRHGSDGFRGGKVGTVMKSSQEIKELEEELSKLTGFIADFGTKEEINNEIVRVSCNVCDALLWVLGEIDNERFRSDAYLDLETLKRIVQNIAERTGQRLEDYD